MHPRADPSCPNCRGTGKDAVDVDDWATCACVTPAGPDSVELLTRECPERRPSEAHVEGFAHLDTPEGVLCVPASEAQDRLVSQGSFIGVTDAQKRRWGNDR